MAQRQTVERLTAQATTRHTPFREERAVTPDGDSTRFRMTLPKKTCTKAGLDPEESSRIDIHRWDELGVILLDLNGSVDNPVELIEAAIETPRGGDDGGE
jgi:hypothetical protein